MDDVPTPSPLGPRLVPGNEDADAYGLAALSRAYAGVDDGAAPTIWTPAQVNIRLIEAFTVVLKTAGSVGPRQFGNGWPAVLREFEDYIGYDHAQYMQDRRVEIGREAARKFTSAELSRSDEAINWASRYLSGDPVLADAIQLWAWSKARGLKIERILRRRRVVADRLRDLSAAEANARRDVAMRATRREIAAKYAGWANERLATAPDTGYAARIRAAARELARKALLEAERALPRPSTAIRRSAVMPGRVFTNQWLDVKRKEAAAVLASALRGAGVPVR